MGFFDENNTTTSMSVIPANPTQNDNMARSFEELGRQAFAIRAVGAKTVLIEQVAATIWEEGQALYMASSGRMLAAAANAQFVNKEHAALVAEFTQLSCQGLGQNLLAYNRIASNALADIAKMSTYIPPKKGFFNR
jgi:hypothetical protein